MSAELRVVGHACGEGAARSSRLREADAVQAATALERLGGVAEAYQLLRWTTRRRLRRAVRDGEVVRLSRGRYGLPTAGPAFAAAAELGAAVVCLRSAAAHHGWALKEQPVRPDLAVRRGRRVSEAWRERARIHWYNVAEDDRTGPVTTPLKTVLDCARQLPFDEALVIVDSALRSGKVTRPELDRAAVRGAGSAAVRRVLRYADGRSANAFESVLRAHAIEAGLDVVPQAELDLVTGTVHPDLVDHGRRLVLEADSWARHATRSGHRSDCSRYNLLVLAGWRVLRFTWEQVMTQPAYVRWVLSQVDRRVQRPEVDTRLPRSA